MAKKIQKKAANASRAAIRAKLIEAAKAAQKN